jgi:hypothetical protein
MAADSTPREIARLTAQEIVRLLRDEQTIPLEWLTANQAATYVKLSARALEQMRGEHRGPKYYRIGPRIIRYRIPDLDAWLTSGSR